MIRNGAFRIAVIARDHGLGVPKLWRHRLGIDCSVQIAELCFHVDSTLAAYGTFIGRLHMSIVARSVDAMPTEHEDNR